MPVGGAGSSSGSSSANRSSSTSSTSAASASASVSKTTSVNKTAATQRTPGFSPVSSFEANPCLHEVKGGRTGGMNGSGISDDGTCSFQGAQTPTWSI